jgi:hypothetical protein
MKVVIITGAGEGIGARRLDEFRHPPVRPSPNLGRLAVRSGKAIPVSTWLPCRQVPGSLGLMFSLLWNTFSGSYFALISASRR